MAELLLCQNPKSVTTSMGNQLCEYFGHLKLDNQTEINEAFAENAV